MPSADMEKRARYILKLVEDGAKDRQKGVERTDNPYKDQTLQSALWRAGWVYGACLLGEEATE